MTQRTCADVLPDLHGAAEQRVAEHISTGEVVLSEAGPAAQGVV